MKPARAQDPMPPGVRRPGPPLPALLTGGIAVLALMAWALDWPELGELWMGVVPMAPSTACCSLLLAAALSIRRVRLPEKAARVLSAGAPLAVAVLVLPSVIGALSLLRSEGAALLSPGTPPFWLMSPLTALFFLLLASAFLLEEFSSSAAAAGPAASFAGTLALVGSAFILLGYLHGLPYLEHTRVIPVAFTTALSLFLLSCAFLASSPERAPARLLAGPSLRARLLRAFLPLLLTAVLADGLAEKAFPGTNPALLHGLSALTALAVLSLLAAWLARRIGDAEALAREALRVSRDKFRRLYQQMLDGYAYADMAGRITECNPAFERMTGYTAEELARLGYSEITPETWRAAEKRIVEEEIIPKGSSGVYEKEYRRKDGSIVPVELLTVLDRDPSGKPAGMWAIIRDLTDRKAAARALAESEEQFRLMFEGHSAVMLLIDPDSGAIVKANGAAAAFYGYSVDALQGMKIWDINTLPRERLQEAIRGIGRGPGGTFIFPHRLSGGETRFVEVHASPITTAAGHLNFAIVHDITERERTSTALKESEFKLREAQRLARIGSWDWDSVTDTITWSPEYYHIYGFDPSRKPPGYEEHLKAYTAESAARLDAAVKRSMGKGEPYVLDLELARPKGPTRWVTARGETRRDDKGRVIGLRGTAQDITARKLAEQAIKESLYFLNESQKAAKIGSYKTDFRAGRWESSEGLDLIFGIGPDYDRSVQGWLGLVHQEDRETMGKYLQEEVLGKRRDFDMEYRIRRFSDGETRWVHGRGAMTFAADGSPVLMIGTIQDVTEWKLAERERELLLGRIKLAADSAGLGVWDWDVKNDALIWDDRMYELYGIKDRAAFKGAYGAWVAALHPLDRGMAEDAIAKALAGEADYHIEFRALRPDGQVRHVRADGIVLRGEDGKPGRMIGVNQDITDSKTAEKLLLAEKLKAESYLEIVGVIMLALEPDQTISLVNRKCCEMLGYSRQELIGRNWFDTAIPEEEREAVKGVFRRIMAGDVAPVEHYENDVLTRSGGRRTVAWTNAIRVDPDGRVVGLLTSGEDVTERRRLENELRELARQRQMALDAASLGWWAYDPVSRVSTYDNGYKRIFEVEGHSKPNDEILKRLHPADLPGVWAKVEAALDPADPKPYFAQYRVRLPDGRVKWVEAYGLAVFEGDGEARRAVNLVGTVADVTARRHAEELLKNYARTLADKNKELEDFLYVASHDLRGPMVNIQGFSQNIGRYCAILSEELKPSEGSRARELLGKDIPEALGFLQGGANRMDALISALLKVSRIGRADFRLEKVDMGALLAEIKGGVSYQLEEAGGTLNIGPLPPCLGDRLQLSQVFYNLVDNALKYRAPDRPPAIEVTGELETDGFARYTVSDNGRGLTQEEADGKIWGLFYRSENSASVPGEGIGLTAAKRIIERHGGSIAASRGAAGGAAFTIRLKEGGG